MTLPGMGSVTKRLARSLLVGLTLLWLAGVLGSGFVLKRLIDERSDDELQESGMILLAFATHIDDMLVTAAVLGEVITPPKADSDHDRMVYQIRDSSGRVLLKSGNMPAQLLDVPLAPGFVDTVDWRVFTVADKSNKLIVQLADPLAERRKGLAHSLLWLMLPLSALLAFAAYAVFRASRSLTQQVQSTAEAVSRQDPQALDMLPVDGVITEMRPAVEATNRLLTRLGEALEAERSFTYNSAHELRTPIAAALAQSQLLAASARDTALKDPSEALVGSLLRLSRLAERLLALARADGARALTGEWVDLAQVVRLTVDEFQSSPQLLGRRIVGQTTPVRVRGDLDAVGLAIRNLVENALAHGVGGSVIHVVCASSQGTASLAVIDDGPGASPDELPSLVKRFRRGRGANAGNAGLGLSIVATLARRMDAELVLKSPPDGQRTGFEARLVWAATGT